MNLIINITYIFQQMVIVKPLLWVEYDKNDRDTFPKTPGRYLIYREKCDKLHFEHYNGTGWSSSNNDCTHYAVVPKPSKKRIIF